MRELLVEFRAKQEAVRKQYFKDTPVSSLKPEELVGLALYVEIQELKQSLENKKKVAL